MTALVVYWTRAAALIMCIMLFSGAGFTGGIFVCARGAAYGHRSAGLPEQG